MHIENIIYRVLRKQKNIDASFTELPEIQQQVSFEYGTWATIVKWKSTDKIQDIFYFENAIYILLHERSNIATFSLEHKKFPERNIFHLECE